MYSKHDNRKALKCYWHIYLPANDSHSQFMKADLLEQTPRQTTVANISTFWPGQSGRYFAEDNFNAFVFLGEMS